ncbi:MAG TPA: response regulator [Bryobacteraceae bacterium]|jgi:PAS domain S-box-containing protein
MTDTLTDPASPPPAILIVEDEALIAMEIRDRLTRLGFQIAGIADTGEKAIREAQRSHPDLILMDIRLKGKMDGVQAAGRIGESLDIPVVYLTAHSDSATLQRAKSAAPFGYILKPFAERDLVVAIEMALHRHGLERRIKESERKAVAILTSIGEGLLVTDPEGCVTYMNTSAEQLTGWKLEEAEGIPVEQVFSLVREDNHQPVGNPVRGALACGAAIQAGEPVCLLTRDSEFLSIEDVSSPMKTDRGDTIGVVVVFRRRERQPAADDVQERIYRQQARVGRDLHEGLAQLLTGIAFLSKSLEKSLADRSENEAADAAHIVRLVNSAIKQTRELSASLLATDSAE